MEKESVGTLALEEAHPSAYAALRWIRSLDPLEIIRWQEAYSSVALSGNRLAEVCSETLSRLLDGKPVSDRYLLGLAWSMRYGKEDERIALRKSGRTGSKAEGSRTEEIKTKGRGRKSKAEGKASRETGEEVTPARRRKVRRKAG